MSRRPLCIASTLAVLACVAPGLVAQDRLRPPSPDQELTLLYDFESDDQLASFTTEDSARASDPGHRPLAYAFPSAIVPPEIGGEHSLHVMFAEASDAWARILVEVDGGTWARIGATGLALWVSCYTPEATVDLVLETAEGTVYRAVVPLPQGGWTHVMLPFDLAVSDDGEPVGERLADVRLLALEKRGTWSSCVFRIDHVELARAGEAPPVAEPTQPPVTEPEQPVLVPPSIGGEPYAATVTTVFRQADTPVYFRTYLGANVLPGEERTLQDPRVAELVRALKPILRTVVTVTPTADGDADMFAAVESRLNAIRPVAKQRGVFICLDAPVDGSVSASRFASFAAALVRRCNGSGAAGSSREPVLYWELLDKPVLLTDGDFRLACQMFNSAAKAMAEADRNVRIGGMSFVTSKEATMDRVLRGTKGLLTFLSWHFYGAPTTSVSDSDLVAAADSGLAYGVPDAIGPAAILKLLSVADLYDSGLLFVTECHLSSARSADGRCEDPRASAPFAAAWTASCLVTAGAFVDAVLLSRLIGPSWGMISEDGTAGPVYWTARLFAERLPRGSLLARSTASTRPDRLLALGAMLDERRVVLLVNRSPRPADVEVQCGAADTRSTATLYSVVPSGSGIEAQQVTGGLASTSQPGPGGATLVYPHIALPPYGVAALELRPGPVR